jgi:hypothetical protein
LAYVVLDTAAPLQSNQLLGAVPVVQRIIDPVGAVAPAAELICVCTDEVIPSRYPISVALTEPIEVFAGSVARVVTVTFPDDAVANVAVPVKVGPALSAFESISGAIDSWYCSNAATTLAESPSAGIVETILFLVNVVGILKVYHKRLKR